MNNLDTTLEQRHNVHGEFEDNAQIADDIFDTLMTSPNWSKMPSVQRVALFQIAHKIGRICSGDNNFKDHWLDIQGYAKLVEDRIQ